MHADGKPTTPVLTLTMHKECSVAAPTFNLHKEGFCQTRDQFVDSQHSPPTEEVRYTYGHVKITKKEYTHTTIFFKEAIITGTNNIY